MKVNFFSQIKMYLQILVALKKLTELLQYKQKSFLKKLMCNKTEIPLKTVRNFYFVVTSNVLFKEII